MSGAAAESGHWQPRARGEPRPRPVSVPPAARHAVAIQDLPVELAAFEHVLDPAVLDAAARRAKRLGVGGDEVLRCAGILSPQQIATGIASRLGIAVDPLSRPFTLRELQAACAGVLLKYEQGEPVLTVAARGTGIRWLAERLTEDPDARAGLRIAAPEPLGEHVRETAADDLAHEAVYGLRDRRPDLSAMHYGWSPLRALGIFTLAAASAAAFLALNVTLIATEYFLAFCFISWTVLRLLACACPRREKSALQLSDRQLPIYTIIVPLYREARVAAKLVAALKRLRYPGLR